MWNGKVTEELKELFRAYMDAHHGIPPDGYDEICYDTFTYEEFVSAIEEALEKGVEFPDVIP